jgi:signal transduction histidine kinase/CheY-like chemotaxis protein/HPt (histidine-containing phosphotransfer) domain-containing protein
MSPLDAAGRAEVERIFEEDAPERLERLAGALDELADGVSGARDTARLEAHSLRGAASIVDREELARLCGSIEELLAEDDPSPAGLRAYAARVRDARAKAGRPAVVHRPLRERLVPHRFMTQLAAILVLTLVPAFGISIYDTYHGRRDAHRTIVREASADALLVAEAEQQLIDGGRRLLLALGQAPEIRRGDARGCKKLFARYAARLHPYGGFAVAAADGRILCSSVRPPPGYSAAKLAAFRAVARTGRFAVGSLQKDPVRGGYVVLVSAPLPRNALGGSQIGAAIRADGIQALIDKVQLPSGSSITVFDRSAIILARRPDPARYVGMVGNLAALRALGKVSGTTETKGIDGVRRVFTYHAAGPWYASVGIPAGPAYATLMRELVYELLLIGGLGLLGLTLGLAGARRALARPLAALVGTAGRLEKGDLSARTGIERHGGELGELAVSIDAMAAALEERTAVSERAAAELAQLADELEERVGERTAALEAAREEADRESRAKSVFLSRLSHELRTPLNAIRGFSQLLRTSDLEADSNEAADHIASGAEHMTKLVEELLDTARIESGEFRIDLEAVDLGEVVREVVELSRGLAADHDVSITGAEVEAGVGVLADRGRLRQVLLNLVTNAIVYNRRGGSVSVRASRGPERRVLVDVLDTGEGIPESDLGRLFVAYDRLGRGSESGGGLGLGLALSKRLVEAMGGTIEVESELGVGTRFTVSLGTMEVPRGVVDEVHGDGRPAPIAARRVLYIEDNATSMKLVELLLRGRGVAFEGAPTAAAGIAAARRESPDLILLDLQLPDGSGEDVLRALRSESSLRAVPIVMLSAQASRDTVRRLLEAGADDYLTKPLEVDRAADVIERFLRRDEN